MADFARGSDPDARDSAGTDALRGSQTGLPADSSTDAPAPARRRPRWVRGLALVCLVAVAGWTAWVYGQIRWYATHDESGPADAIAVFGAAEYDGRPSPVLRARLDRGLQLYREKLAPVVITLGGGDPTDRHSEGAVGQEYLLGHEVPESAIVAETRSRDTHESVARLVVIARANGYKRILVVSDGTHLFRIHALCAAEGLDVRTSPRAENRVLPLKAQVERVGHEIVSYTAFRLGLH